jgi:positive regulator of sigma E activity
MNNNEVSHTGRITEIDPQFTTVEIISQSACGSCHAAGICGVSEYSRKAIQVPTDPNVARNIGDEVNVVLKQSMGMKAVWISYVIPLLILMILVLSLSALKVHELLTGLAAIAGVGLYYLIVFLFRDKLADEYVFYIKDK